MKKTLLAFLLVVSPLAASPVTFAQFHQTANTTPFAWNNGPGGSFFTYDGSSTTQFCFLVPTSAGACDVEATLTFEAFTDDAAVVAGAIVQPIDSGSFSFNRVSDGAALLSATFSQGFLTGIAGASGGTLTFSTAGIGTVVFSSDFLTFGDPQDFSFGFTALAPPLSIGANGQVDDFRADGSGTFSAEIPEPATAALVCLGFIVLCAHRRKTL